LFDYKGATLLYLDCSASNHTAPKYYHFCLRALSRLLNDNQNNSLLMWSASHWARINYYVG